MNLVREKQQLTEQMFGVFIKALLRGCGSFSGADEKSFLVEVIDDGQLQLTLKKKGNEPIILSGWNTRWNSLPDQQTAGQFSAIFSINPSAPDDQKTTTYAMVFLHEYGINEELDDVKFLCWKVFS
eukprot:GHVS01035115.1.p2 GENE.GHVS01035115.1~~GHVS01035115.1.p2  ORF type:complete len:126 (-),score=13.09 GHVS01035115.1:175-552(-)